jgi:polyvinyl alcohol dehydrogenase (cytochrome)
MRRIDDGRQSGPGSSGLVTAVGAWLIAAILTVGFLLAAGPAGAAVPAWTTYGHDSARSQTDPDSTAPVAPAAAWSTGLDGVVVAQPLVDGSRVYVATENDTIAAVDAATGAVAWQRSLGAPVPSGDLPCGDISPTVGITGTPVIDPVANRIYAVADTITGSTIAHRLYALDLTSGSVVPGFPIDVDPANQNPAGILQRSALALDAGRIAIGYGGNDGDCSSYHGYLVSAPADGAGSNTVFEVDGGAGESQGSIWGAGDGPAQDGAGHLFIETGNGNSSTNDLQESVVELDANANVLAHWTPTNWKQLDTSDTDLGSAEPLPLPGGLLFVAGKDGVGRLVSATALGSAGQVFSAAACSSGGVYGASLYHAGIIYVPCSSGLVALALNGTGAPSFSMVRSFTPPAGASGPPIFAGGLVWSTGWRGTQLLYGLDPATGAIRYDAAPGTFAHFVAPSAGGGRLFVAASDRLSAWTIAGYPPTTTTGLTASPNPVTAGRAVTYTATVSPAPDGGAVAFTSDGAVIGGCGAVVPSPTSGTASCTTTPPPGTHAILARYEGDAFFGPSSSSPLTEQVTAVAPRITRATLRPHRATAARGTTVSYRLSQAATVTVQIARLRVGRRRHRRCVIGPRRGARCTISHRVRRLRVRAGAGARRLHLRLRGLLAGRYTVTLIARGGDGLNSRRVTLRLVIVRPRRR